MRRDGGNHATTIKLAVFDLDGTLTRSGTSVLCHVGERFGFADTAKRLSVQYADGTLRNADVSGIAAQHLRDRCWIELQDALTTLPMVNGIGDTIALLGSLNVYCALATITFDFAAQYVARCFGIQRVSATTLEWSPDNCVTGLRHALEAEDKCRFIERQCDELGVSPEEVLVVGDARQDIPAMEIAGWSVGFNPTNEVADIASVSLRSTDLRDVVPHIRHLLAAEM